MSNEEYFNKQCEVIEYLSSRDDRDHSAIKTVIRCAVREACNFANDLPGYDNKKGATLVSREALSQIQEGDFSHLVGEHVVPISVVLQKLREAGKPRIHKISEIIKKFSTRAVITKCEDMLLRQAGLTTNMPKGWNGQDELARYKHVRIQTLEETYLDLYKRYNKSSKKDARKARASS